MSINKYCVPLISYFVTSRRGLISLDSSGGIKPSISTIVNGWLCSLWRRLIFSLHLLNSVLFFIWNTICALSGILSSNSGWLRTYLLNSAERVRCSSQKYSSLNIIYLMNHKFYYFIFSKIMLMPFAAIITIRCNKAFNFSIHKKIVSAFDVSFKNFIMGLLVAPYIYPRSDYVVFQED